MAVAFVKAHTLTSIKAAGTGNLSITLSSVVPAGNLIVVALVFDNAATASKPIVTLINRAVGEAGGNLWTSLGRSLSTSTTAGAFASAELMAIKTTVDWPATSYAIAFDTTTVMKAAIPLEFSGAEAAVRSTSGTNYSTTTTAASAVTTGTTPVIGDLAIGLLFGSNVAAAQAGDTDTLGGAWSTARGVGSTGAGAATNNYGITQYKILTAASHQTYNNSAAMTAGNGAIVAILQATLIPAITQAAYRWFGEGTESAATALAAQDTAVTGNITNGDATGTLRVRLQSTNAVAVPATDDWQLQYEKNLSGSWVNVTAVSTAASTYDSPNLTNGAATTNRLTGGTGTFVAGKVSEDSLMDDLGWAGNNYTELVYALKIKAADLVNGDTLRFRVLRNGATTTMTYTQTPRIDIVRTDPAVTQAAYRFYADGTESGSTALAAQNAAGTADLTTSDAVLGVRMLLQSTNSANLPATDDWQLQWEKNASGTWTRVPGLGGQFDGCETTDNFGSHLAGGNLTRGQTFYGNGRNLTRASFRLWKVGAPPGTVTAKLWAYSGSALSGGTVGAVLATSTTTLNSAAVLASPQWFDFDFNVALSADVPYVIGLTADTDTDSSNAFVFSVDIAGSDTAHPGQMQVFSSPSTWYVDATQDAFFKVYSADLVGAVTGYPSGDLTENGATTNRLTGGTGTFTAGKVSEDGVADNLGWAGNNYTEVLYSLTLRAADLVNGDTLRFRVLRNGATTGITYTQTPTFTVSKTAVYTVTGSLGVTTTVTAATTRATTSPTTALAITTNRSAAATRTALSTTTALAVTTSRTAAATRTGLAAATALVVTTSRTAATSRTTLPATTALAVVTSRTAGTSHISSKSVTTIPPFTTGWEFDTQGTHPLDYTATTLALPAWNWEPGAWTTSRYNLTGERVFWRFATVPVQEFDTFVTAQLEEREGNHVVFFNLEDGTLQCGLIVSGTYGVVNVNVTWDASKPFLSLRETGGTVFWERSSSGSPGTWETIASGSAPPVTSMELSFWVYADVLFEDQRGTLTVDHVNTPMADEVIATTMPLAVTTSISAAASRTTLTGTTALAVTTSRAADTRRSTATLLPFFFITTTITASAARVGISTATAALSITTSVSAAPKGPAFSTLSSDFTTGWQMYGSASTTSTRLTLPGSPGDSTGASTLDYYSLDESRVLWKVTQLPTTSYLAMDFFSSTGVGFWEWTVEDDNIEIWEDEPTALVSVAWDPTKPFLSMREAGGSIHYERSTTGQAGSWEVLLSTSTAGKSFDSVRMDISVGANATGTAWVENLNTPEGTGYTVTTVPLAVTTTVAAAQERTTLPVPTALAVTTSRSAAATRTTFAAPAAALVVTTSRAAAATRTTLTASTALAVTTSRTAAVLKATVATPTALAVTTNRTAAATRTGLTAPIALAVTTTATAATSRATTVPTTALPVTTTATAAAITGAGVVATLAVTTSRSATVTKTTFAAPTALAVTSTLTSAVVKTAAVTTTALAVTTSRSAAICRVTFATITALSVTTVASAATLRAAAPAGATLAVTTTRTATAVRTAAPATAALPVTVTRTATAVRTAAPATAALAVITSRTAAATRTALAAPTTLPVVTSRSASVVKATTVGTTSLAVTTSLFSSPTPGGAVSPVALAVTTSRTAAATRTTFTPGTALAVVTSRSAAVSRVTFTSAVALAVTTSRTATATRTTFLAPAALAVTTSRTASTSRVTSVSTTSLTIITTISAATTPGAAIPTVALSITTTRTAVIGRVTYTSTTTVTVTTTLSATTERVTLVPTVALSVVTTRTAELSVTTPSGAVGGGVVVDGTTKTVVMRWVVVGEVKKSVVASSVVVGGVKHAVK